MIDSDIEKFLGIGRKKTEIKRDAKGRFAPADKIMADYEAKLKQVHADIPMVDTTGRRKKKALTKEQEEQRIASRKRADSALLLQMYKDLDAVGSPVSNRTKRDYVHGSDDDPYIQDAKKAIVTKSDVQTMYVRGNKKQDPMGRFTSGVSRVVADPKHGLNTTKMATDSIGTPLARKADSALFGKNRVGDWTARQADKIHITSEQSRAAGTLATVGGPAGGLTGTAVGATLGAAVKRPKDGAFLGAAVGGAVGGGGGAAMGLYSARPGRKRKKPALTGTAPPKLSVTTPGKVNKAFSRPSKDQVKAGAIGGGVGLGASLVTQRGASVGAQRNLSEAHQAANLNGFKLKSETARQLQGTADFLGSAKGRALVVGGAAAYGIHRHNKKKAAMAPIGKAMDPAKKDKLKRRAVTGALGVGIVADAAALKAGWRETAGARRAEQAAGVVGSAKHLANRASFPLQVAGLGAGLAASKMINSPKPPKQPKPTTVTKSLTASDYFDAARSSR